MKKIILLTLMLCLLGLTSAQAYENSLDQIVAVVNDDIITTSELNQAAGIVKLQLKQQDIPIPAETVLKKQVLEQLINKRLQLQIVKQANIKVTDAEYNRAIETIAKQNNMSVAEFYQRLEREGMNKETYKKEMHEQMELQKLQQTEIINRIHMTPDDLKAFAKTLAPQKAQITKIYNLEDILIPLSDEPSTADIANAKNIADTILQELKQNIPTTQAIKSFDSVTMTQLGTKLLSDLPAVFADAVQPLKKNDIAGPIQTGNGFHLLRIVDLKINRREPKAPTQKELENGLGQRKFEEAFQIWLAKIRSQAYIVNKLTGSRK